MLPTHKLSPLRVQQPTSYIFSSIRELVKYGLRGSDGQEVMKCIFVWFGFHKERLDGKVVEGMDVVRKMESVGSEDVDTSKPVVIKDCEMAK